MDVNIKVIMNMEVDKATCCLLTIDKNRRILLDCGIGPTFSFSNYKNHEHLLKLVDVVLISHSTLQYSGALPFLVSQLGINPKLVFTTQPIMRYAPLTLHQHLLNSHIAVYGKKIFNKIYHYYEQVNLVKPYQRQSIGLKQIKQEQMESQQDVGMKKCNKLYFVCYLAGGYLGSIYWKITYGLVNIVYLIDYNNYSSFHLPGIDISNLISSSTQPVNLLITDGYVQNQQCNKMVIYQDIKSIICQFLIKVNRQPQFDHKLLIVCDPSQMIVQFLIMLRMAMNDFGQKMERVNVVHLSYRFLELIKSQSEHFTDQFQQLLRQLNNNFQQNRKSKQDNNDGKPFFFLKHKINVCGVNSLSNVIAANKNENLTIQLFSTKPYLNCNKQMKENLKTMKLFDQQQIKTKNELQVKKEQKKQQIIKMQIQIQNVQKQISVNQNIENQNQYDIIQDIHDLNKLKKNFKNKYITQQSGIPRFNQIEQQTDDAITEYGLRFYPPENDRLQSKTKIDQGDINIPALDGLFKKQSKIDVMNVQFSIPEVKQKDKEAKINIRNRNFTRTQFNSSTRIIQFLNPKDIVFLNLSENQLYLKLYREEINRNKRTIVHELISKKQLTLNYYNQVLSLKMNYLQEMKRCQKVKGTIKKTGHSITIHLDYVEDDSVYQFKLQNFYLNLKKKYNMWIRKQGGLCVEGINIYRQENMIILEGQYSQEYFNIRREIYKFIRKK